MNESYDDISFTILFKTLSILTSIKYVGLGWSEVREYLSPHGWQV